MTRQQLECSQGLMTDYHVSAKDLERATHENFYLIFIYLHLRTHIQKSTTALPVVQIQSSAKMQRHIETSIARQRFTWNRALTATLTRLPCATVFPKKVAPLSRRCEGLVLVGHTRLRCLPILFHLRVRTSNSLAFYAVNKSAAIQSLAITSLSHVITRTRTR